MAGTGAAPSRPIRRPSAQGSGQVQAQGRRSLASRVERRRCGNVQTSGSRNASKVGPNRAARRATRSAWRRFVHASHRMSSDRLSATRRCLQVEFIARRTRRTSPTWPYATSSKTTTTDAVSCACGAQAAHGAIPSTKPRIPSLGCGTSRLIPSMSSHSIPSDFRGCAMAGTADQSRRDVAMARAKTATVNLSVSSQSSVVARPALPMSGPCPLTTEWERWVDRKLP